MNKEIKKYIEKQQLAQKEILKRLRKIFLKTIPSCNEEMAWGVITFVNKKFYLAALKDSVNVGFAINGLSKDEISLFKGAGKTMRHLKIKTLKDINEKELVKLIKLVNKKAKCKPC